MKNKGNKRRNEIENTSIVDLMTKEGPISYTRKLLDISRSCNVISITYHYFQKYSPPSNRLPFLHFETGLLRARTYVPKEHAYILERCHKFVIKLGKPIILSSYIPAFRATEPTLTSAILAVANEMGVEDQYMVPVFGPHDVNGLIAFSFAETIVTRQKDELHTLDSAAAAHHNRLVRHFAKRRKDVELSPRENDVLKWIARGKTTAEISVILGISKSSVDTYTRRIFEKMGVNDRVSAAVKGVVGGMVGFH